MNYIRIDEQDTNNGPGVRTVLWVAGCAHACTNCHNPETHNFNAGQEWDAYAVRELFETLSDPNIAGLTITGGDPFHPRNKGEVISICKVVKNLFPEKTIWVWTGYTMSNDDLRNYRGIIDVIVDGMYDESQPDVGDNPWIGSNNQVVHYINV